MILLLGIAMVVFSTDMLFFGEIHFFYNKILNGYLVFLQNIRIFLGIFLKLVQITPYGNTNLLFGKNLIMIGNVLYSGLVVF